MGGSLTYPTLATVGMCSSYPEGYGHHEKTALEAAALKHLSRWHKTNIEEELMKARAFTAALIALEESEATESDLRPFSLHNAERVGTIWRTTSGRLQIQLEED